MFPNDQIWKRNKLEMELSEGCLWKAAGDPADRAPGEGSQRSGRESEMGTDSSSSDTGAQLRQLASQEQHFSNGTVPAPGSGLLSGHTLWQCWFQCSCTEREGTRDVLKPLSALTSTGWSSRLPRSRAQEHARPGLCSTADPRPLLFPEPGHA